MSKKAKKNKSILETFEAEIVKDAGEYVKEKVKRKVLRIGEISMLIILGFMLISIGLAFLLGTYYPILNNGLNFLILGIFFLIVSFALKI